jgi:hypothetical protein
MACITSISERWAVLMRGIKQEERDEVRREALLRAVAIVQRYQDENWRRLRVNNICMEIKRLIKEEAASWTP